MTITAYLFPKTLTITDPASLYLQSEDIDILTAIRLVGTVQPNLFKLRGKFFKVRKAAEKLCAAHELEEHDFVEKRLRERLFL